MSTSSELYLILPSCLFSKCFIFFIDRFTGVFLFLSSFLSL